MRPLTYLVIVASSEIQMVPFAGPLADQRSRLSLFVRFVQTLGPQEFLSAVGMLLISKDVKATDGSSLPLALFEHFSIDAQLHVRPILLCDANRVHSDLFPVGSSTNHF